jgi:hypothetical protein
MATETKQSNLSIAFDNVRNLNLGLTTEQFLDLNEILYDLATKQHSKGMADAKEIYKNYNNL